MTTPSRFRARRRISRQFPGEKGRARDDHVRPGLADQGQGSRIHPAVYRYYIREIVFPHDFFQFAHLFKAGHDHLLPAEPRINGHYEDKVDEWQDFLKRGYRGRGNEADAGLEPSRPYLGGEPMRVDGGFNMKGNRIGPRLDKRGNMDLGIVDHQVDVERELAQGPERLDDRRADR
jgi:hypothetical protein